MAETAMVRDEHPYRMKDLCEATGLERQAIHFYIQQGLLPPGRKTGRNMAWYGEVHLQRLRLIKKLQEERFLPLRAIKAILNGPEETFTPAQSHFLSELRTRMAAHHPSPAVEMETVDAEELITRLGVERADLDRAIAIGIIAVQRDDSGTLRIAARDQWMVELFSEIRKIGFTQELGFEVDDLAFYEDAMTQIFHREVRLLSSRISHLPPDQAIEMIERALPLINTFLSNYHTARIREFFAVRP